MALNLNQQRAVEGFKGYLADWEKSVKEIVPDVGFDVKLDTMFNFTPEDANPESVTEYWKDLYFEALKVALQGVASDDLGKNSLKNSLKRIVIEATEDTSDASTATFKDGVFTINQHPYAESGSLENRASIWRKTIEAQL